MLKYILENENIDECPGLQLVASSCSARPAGAAPCMLSNGNNAFVVKVIAFGITFNLANHFASALRWPDADAPQ